MKRFLLFIVAATAASLLLLALSAGSPMGISSLIANADPLWILIHVAVALALCSFFAGMVTGDYSWVDRLWSTAPVVFVWFYAWRASFSPALLIAAVLVTMWGTRLTLNFARKGGYSGEEDYRWAILRKRITNKFAWQAFNLLFISFYQIGLFILFTLPAYLLWQNASATTQAGLNLGFIISAVALVAFIGYESIADSQQWNFQIQKKRAANSQALDDERFAADIEQGFLSSGLFGFSRHPNYFGEIAVWWALYFMAAFYSGQLLNLTLIGPIMLTLLFIGSTAFTEAITAAKYPGYRDYCRRTSPIIPWFRGASHPTPAHHDIASR